MGSRARRGLRAVLPGLVLGLLAPNAMPASEGRHAIRSTPRERIRAVNAFEIRCPGFTAETWHVVAPAAPVLPGQADVSATMEPAGAPTTDMSPLRRSILAARVPVTGEAWRHGLTYAVEYEATLVARELVRVRGAAAEAHVPPLAPAERDAFLAATPTFFDFETEAFQGWLTTSGLRRGEGESALELGRRVFLFVTRRFAYESRSGSDRRASAICRAGRSDCGGLATLFLAALRANGVPARCLVGKWATSMEPGVVIGDIPFAQQHVKAEFFADGVGWVPVDPASAILHDRSRKGERYFGRDPGDFIAFQVDYDVVIETQPWGRSTQPWLWFACWPEGSGTMEGATRREDWRVETIERSSP